MMNSDCGLGAFPRDSWACWERQLVRPRSTVETMPSTESTPAERAVEAEISRVLTAERDAKDAVAHATRDAVERNERARAAARALAERTEGRIRAVRAASEARTAAEVAAIDAQSAEQDTSQPLSADDLRHLERALAALATELTGEVA